MVSYLLFVDSSCETWIESRCLDEKESEVAMLQCLQGHRVVLQKVGLVTR